MVEPAEQDHVLRSRRPAVGPVDQVVRFAPGDRQAAPAPSAPLGLLGFELAAKEHVRHPQVRALLDHLAGGVVVDHRDDPGLAGQEAGLGDRDRAALQTGHPAGVLALKGLEVDRDVQRGGVAVAGGGLGAGARPGEQLVQGLGVPVRGVGQHAVGVGLLLAGRRHGGLEEVREQPSRVGRDGAVDLPHAVGPLGHLQVGQGLLGEVVEQRHLVEEPGDDLIDMVAQLGVGGVPAVLADELFRGGAADLGVVGARDRAGGDGGPGVDHEALLVEGEHGVGDGVDAGGAVGGGLGERLELGGEAGDARDLGGGGVSEVEALAEPFEDAGEPFEVLVHPGGGVLDDGSEGAGVAQAGVGGEGFELGAEGFGLGGSVGAHGSPPGDRTFLLFQGV